MSRDNSLTVKFDINTCSVEELQRVGLSSHTAQAIVRQREARGTYTSISDLLYITQLSRCDFLRLQPVATVTNSHTSAHRFHPNRRLTANVTSRRQSKNNDDVIKSSTMTSRRSRGTTAFASAKVCLSPEARAISIHPGPPLNRWSNGTNSVLSPPAAVDAAAVATPTCSGVLWREASKGTSVYYWNENGDASSCCDDLHLHENNKKRGQGGDGEADTTLEDGAETPLVPHDSSYSCIQCRWAAESSGGQLPSRCSSDDSLALSQGSRNLNLRALTVTDNDRKNKCTKDVDGDDGETEHQCHLLLKREDKVQHRSVFKPNQLLLTLLASPRSDSNVKVKVKAEKAKQQPQHSARLDMINNSLTTVKCIMTTHPTTDAATFDRICTDVCCERRDVITASPLVDGGAGNHGNDSDESLCAWCVCCQGLGDSIIEGGEKQPNTLCKPQPIPVTVTSVEPIQQEISANQLTAAKSFARCKVERLKCDSSKRGLKPRLGTRTMKCVNNSKVELFSNVGKSALDHEIERKSHTNSELNWSANDRWPSPSRVHCSANGRRAMTRRNTAWTVDADMSTADRLIFRQVSRPVLAGRHSNVHVPKKKSKSASSHRTGDSSGTSRPRTGPNLTMQGHMVTSLREELGQDYPVRFYHQARGQISCRMSALDLPPPLEGVKFSKVETDQGQGQSYTSTLRRNNSMTSIGDVYRSTLSGNVLSFSSSPGFYSLRQLLAPNSNDRCCNV